MRKRLFCLLLLLCLAAGLCACDGAGEPVVYNTPHEHVFGFWYDVDAPEGQAPDTQVRYCKICHAEQTREINAQ